MYLAHKENEKKQELTVHLLEAGQYAQSEGEKIGIGTLATLCLQLHDAGKFSTEFQAYIKQEDDLPKWGAVNHSSAGAELLMQEFKNSPYHSVQDMRLLIELISYTITAHHGIYDCIDEDGEDKFEVRLNVVEKEKLDEIARLWFEEMHFKTIKTNLSEWTDRRHREIFLYELYGTIAFVFANRFRLDRYSKSNG